MPSKWIKRIHQGHLGAGWSWREKSHRCNPTDKSYNAGERVYDMRSYAKFYTKATNEDGPSSV